MENITQKFIDRIFDLSNRNINDKIIRKSKMCFIDYLGVVIGACKIYEESNKKFILENKFTGEYPIIGCDIKADLRTAVMINAFNAHVLELDDSHRVAMTHLGASIFSSLIGVAQLYNKTLDDVIRAAVIGYEASIRLANSIQPGHKKRGFHVSGTCCSIGCALAISSMLNYTKEEMMNVMSAATTSAAGLLCVISGESEQKPYNIANAAVAGVNAALYGKHFIGAVDALGDSRGFFNAVTDKCDVRKLCIDCYDEYAIEGIYQKIYAACRHCHAPVEAILNIRKNYQFEIEDIKEIQVEIYDLAIKGHDHTQIKGISSAKQSIPYSVAVACIEQKCSIDAFTLEKVNNKKINDLVKKVYVVENEELTKLVPQKRGSIVTVVLKNLMSISERVDYPKGEPENPISDEEMFKKYDMLVNNSNVNKTDLDSFIDRLGIKGR